MSDTYPRLKVGLVQTWADEDPASNLERTLALVADAAARGAKVVCLQELFRTRYFCQEEEAKHFALAEPLAGPTGRALAAAAAQHGVTLLGSLFEKRAPGIHQNTAVVYLPDGEVGGVYRKMHIPDDPRFYEKFYFLPGDGGFRAFDTPAGRLGVLVCWDQWFPEAARATALQGPSVLFYPTAIGTWSGELEEREAQHDAWKTVQRSHAIANGLYVVAVNRVGVEDELHFWGRSFVAGPDGRILAEAGDGEEVLVVELDLRRIDEVRQGWPFFRDRRVDHYDDLLMPWIGEAYDVDA